MTRALLLAPLALLACGGGEGTWETEIYGEPFIEEGIPADAFPVDGCSATFSKMLVVLSEAALVDGNGADDASLPTATVFDLVAPGPHLVSDMTATAQHFDSVRFVVAPAASMAAGNVTDADVTSMDGKSLHAVGELTCGGVSKAFDWTFDTSTTYSCEPEDLTIPNGGVDRTQLTIHGDHLFYDGLENEDAKVQGLAIHEADADNDGNITQAELAMVPVAPLGYQVGQFAEVTDLAAFISHLTTSMGHVDGEGHCDVSRP